MQECSCSSSIGDVEGAGKQGEVKILSTLMQIHESPPGEPGTLTWCQVEAVSGKVQEVSEDEQSCSRFQKGTNTASNGPHLVLFLNLDPN